MWPWPRQLGGSCYPNTTHFIWPTRVQNLTAVASVVPELQLEVLNFKIGHVTWPRRYQGWLVIRKLGLVMINLPTKIVHPLWRCKRQCKMKKLGWFRVVKGHPRSSAIWPFERAHMTSYFSLIVTMHLSCTILVIASYLLKVANFNLSHLHLAFPVGWLHSNFNDSFGTRSMDSLGYHVELLCVILSLAILNTIPVCDRHTCTHTRMHTCMHTRTHIHTRQHISR